MGKSKRMSSQADGMTCAVCDIDTILAAHAATEGEDVPMAYGDLPKNLCEAGMCRVCNLDKLAHLQCQLYTIHGCDKLQKLYEEIDELKREIKRFTATECEENLIAVVDRSVRRFRVAHWQRRKRHEYKARLAAVERKINMMSEYLRAAAPTVLQSIEAGEKLSPVDAAEWHGVNTEEEE